MIKLLIVDDERFIRETIAALIDWKALGIELIGSACDGIEAYNIILDEYPDIVMTDIKMPGLSGLELIQKIYNANNDTAFIILSGYDDFEFAKEAMKYGVRHYLLKPCKKEQIVSCITDTIGTLSHRTARIGTEKFSRTLSSDIFLSILSQCIASGGAVKPGSLLKAYEKYLDFSSTPYMLCTFTNITDEQIDAILEELRKLCADTIPGTVPQGIRAYHTLYVFFETASPDFSGAERFSSLLKQFPAFCTCTVFLSLEQLFEEITDCLCRFETIYYINGCMVTPLCNYQNLMKEVTRLTVDLRSPFDKNTREQLSLLLEILSAISDANFLRQLASSIFLQCTAKDNQFGTVQAAEFLLELNELDTADKIYSALSSKLLSLYSRLQRGCREDAQISAKIKEYVEQNLSDPDLSLKWISEHYIYMNVDYISKRFYKETGQKFSHYLTDLRIAKAKELLSHSDTSKIQYVAEKVGCGNNPQYFSQFFKRYTGMTPSKYLQLLSGSSAP